MAPFETVILLSDECIAEIEVGDTVTIEDDDRHWSVIGVDGNEITIVPLRVN